MSFEYARDPSAAQDDKTLARGAFHVIALAAPYLEPRERELFDRTRQTLHRLRKRPTKRHGGNADALETLPARRHPLRLRRRGARQSLAGVASRRLRTVPGCGMGHGDVRETSEAQEQARRRRRRRLRCNRRGAPIIAAISPRRSPKATNSGRSARTPPTRRPTSTRPISSPMKRAGAICSCRPPNARSAAGGGAGTRQRLLFSRAGARALLAGNLDRSGR